MENPTETANKLFKYDTVFFDLSLDEWCQKAHKKNCIENRWFHKPLASGAFGYDNLIISLGYTLNKIKESGMDISDIDIEKLASWIHEGWGINYLYWRDNKPWTKKHVGNYRRPNKTLNDERRNKCLSLSYDELPEDEKEKDVILAKFIVGMLKK